MTPVDPLILYANAVELVQDDRQQDPLRGGTNDVVDDDDDPAAPFHR